MVDVLHHIESPLRLFAEAARVLRPGGRLIACEPAITPLSGLFYRRFHDEPVDMSADPLKTADRRRTKGSLRFEPGDPDAAGRPLSRGLPARGTRTRARTRRLFFFPRLSAVRRFSRMEPDPRGGGAASARGRMDDAASVRATGGVPPAGRLPPNWLICAPKLHAPRDGSVEMVSVTTPARRTHNRARGQRTRCGRCCSARWRCAGSTPSHCSRPWERPD